MRMYICVLDEFPDFMTPTLVAHATLGAHLRFERRPEYQDWLENSFKKCVVKVNCKEFDRIMELDDVYRAHEIHTLGGKTSCLIPMPRKEVPNVLKFAKLWKPVENQS